MEDESVISRNRQKYILNVLKKAGTIKVQDLSDELGVSPITIRRDLDKLDEKGFLERTHGGAIINREIQFEHSFVQKFTMFNREKKCIGKLAASLLKEGDTLMLNGGSTVLEIMRNIQNKHVRILTNNASATTVELEPNAELIMLGGQYNRISNSLVGEFAQIGLHQVYSSITMLGVNGIDTEHGLTSSVYLETTINKLMIERTKGPVIVVADHSKLGLVANFITAPVSAVTTIVTDSGADHSLVEKFRQSGIEVLVAQLDSSENL